MSCTESAQLFVPASSGDDLCEVSPGRNGALYGTHVEPGCSAQREISSTQRPNGAISTFLGSFWLMTIISTFAAYFPTR